MPEFNHDLPEVLPPRIVLPENHATEQSRKYLFLGFWNTQFQRAPFKRYQVLSVSLSVMSNSLWLHGLYSTPGFSIHRILQARILEWIAIPFSRGSSWPVDQTQLSCIAGRFFTVWVAREASKDIKCACSISHVQLCNPMVEPTRLLCPWNFLGKNTGVGCHFLLQGNFPIQGSNTGLLHCRQILYHLKPPRKPQKYQGSY